MRYPTTHKDLTRQRIINVSSRLFKEHGIDATGLASIMSEANLTNGAFYAHFASKEALVEAVIADQLQAQLEQFGQAPKDINGLKQIINIYLSKEHLSNCSEGCPSAALLDEIVKRPNSTKNAYTNGLKRIVKNLADSLPETRPEKSESLIISLVSLLIGTLQLSRAVTDEMFSAQILESGRATAHNLLDKHCDP